MYYNKELIKVLELVYLKIIVMLIKHILVLDMIVLLVDLVVDNKNFIYLIKYLELDKFFVKTMMFICQAI